MKNLMKLIFIFLPTIIFSQTRWNEERNNQLSLSAGWKSLEASYAYTAPCELIFGISIVGADSKLLEKRANKNDINKNVHKFNDNIIPAAFGLIGAKFDNTSIIGKLGSVYIDQDINSKKEPQNIYFTVGIIFDQKISELMSLRVSYDNVSGPMIGTTLHF